MGIMLRVPKRGSARHPDTVDLKDSSKLFINELTNSLEDRERLETFLMTEHQGDMDVVPTCHCKLTKADISSTMGTICPSCGDEVSLRSDKKVEPILYVHKPKGITSLITPNVWYMIRDLAAKGTFNTLLYMTDPTYRDKANPEYMDELNSLKFERSYNYFIENIEYMIGLILKLKHVRKKEGAKTIMKFCRTYKNDFMVSNLYTMNKSLVIVESNSTGKYMFPALGTMQNSVKGMVGIDVSSIPVSERENRTARFIDKLATFYYTYTKTMFSKKKGLWKKHVFNVKGVHTYRSVIVSIAGPQIYNQVTIPWTIAVKLMETYIISKLIRRGYTIGEAKEYHHNHLHVYSDKMYSILKELISDRPDGRIYLLTQRFPTLSTASMIRVWFNDVITNPAVHAIGYPLLIVAGPNADYDGDEMHNTLLYDQSMVDSMEGLEYHYNIIDRTSYRSLSSNLTIPTPALINFSSWYEDSNLLQSTVEEDNNMFDLYG